MTRFALIFLFCAVPLFCQSNSGELRLRVTDPVGPRREDHRADHQRTPISIATLWRPAIRARSIVQRLPYGIYQLEIQPAWLCAGIRICRNSFLDSDRIRRSNSSCRR